MKIRVVEYLPEPGFEFESASVVEVNGALTAGAIVGGRLCCIETKESLVEAGVAFCCPFEVDLDWPFSVVVEVEEFGEVERRTLHECTADSRIVAAARRFNELPAGTLRVGMNLG